MEWKIPNITFYTVYWALDLSFMDHNALLKYTYQEYILFELYFYKLLYNQAKTNIYIPNKENRYFVIIFSL